MKNWIVQLFISVLKILYSLMRLFPTDKRIVFLSRQSDKPSIDFILLIEKFKADFPDYKIIVLTKKFQFKEKIKFKNKLKYGFNLIIQMYHIARAQLAILDSYNIVISLLEHKKSLLVVQIWHALGSMKKFGWAMVDKPEGTKKKFAELMKMHRNYDYALISSLNFKNDFIEGFKIESDKIIEIPLPKVDLLMDKAYRKQKKEELLKKYPDLGSKENIIYCPTFRKNQDDETIAIQRLIDVIDKQKYNLIIKLHPLSSKESIKLNSFHIKESTFDSLFIADYVISDYSSVIYEAGLLEIPLYFYAYDWDCYRLRRELNFDIEQDAPGLFTSDPKKIADLIDDNTYDFDKLKRFIAQNIHITGESSLHKISKLVNKHLKH